ncbi:MAG: carboxypeptidase regulatory-like domain-containing protein [Bradymonadaceae bacterium]
MKRALFLILGALLVLLVVAFLLSRGTVESRDDVGLVTAEHALEEAQPAIRGRVHTPSGRPVVGALVKAGDQTVTSDESGAFVFAELADGTYFLDAEADDFVRPGPGNAGRPEVTVVAGGTVENVSLILQDPSRISGRVLARGQPVEGAVLGLYYLFGEGIDGRPLEPFSIGEVARTDENGAFRIDHIAPGRLRVLVETEEHAFAESGEVYLRGGDTRDNLRIELVASGGLTGLVVTEDGTPIRAEVVLSGSVLSRSRRIDTEADGRFSFAGLPVGDVTLNVRAPGYRAESVEGVAIEEGETVTYDVIMSAARGIFGRVIDSEGAPAPGASVIFSSPGKRNHHTRAREDGTFAWDEAPEGAWTAVAVTPAGEPSEETRAPHGEELVLRLRVGGEVAGRVVDGRGMAVDSYTIAVDYIEVGSLQTYGTRSIPTKRIARADGQFEFGPLRPGAYRFRVEAPGRAPGTSERVTVRAGALTSGVVIRLGEGATVAGRVTSVETGEPVAGAQVSVFEPTSVFPGNSTRTNDDGEYSLGGVASGRRSLRVVHDGYLTEVAGGLSVPAGGELRRDITISKRAPGQGFSFHGIGAVLSRGERGIELVNVMDGMPAEAYGLAVGDVIRSVDRESTENMELDRVVEMIRGEEGAPVSLEVERDGEGVFILEVERGRVVIRSQRRN